MSSIFEDGQKPADPQTPPVTPPAQQIPETLKDLIGEGKKYATLDKALESLPHAQQHISKLEQELAQLREQKAKEQSVDDVRKTVEELLAQRGGDPAKQLDEASIASLVNSVVGQQLSAHEQQRVVAGNVKRFKDTLGAAYGDKAKEQFETTAKSLGMTPEGLSQLVQTSPDAALRLFDLKTGGTKPLQSDLNSHLFSGTKSIPDKKSVMYGASTKDVMAQWDRAKLIADSKE